MELTLTPEIENAINKQAIRRGVTPERLVLESLKQLFVIAETKLDEQPATLADFLDGYIGVIHSSQLIEGGARFSENSGSKFAQLMRHKRKQDHL